MLTRRKLVQWDQEDTNNLYKCEWIRTFEFEDIENKWQRRKYYNSIYEKLIFSLPKPELEYMNKHLSTFSTIGKRKKFENTIKYIIYDMRRKLLAHEVERENKLDNVTIKREITFQEYRARKLLNDETNVNKQSSHKSYYPTTEILNKLPPMEIIEYVGFKVIKYDKFYDHYAAILHYPYDMYRMPIIMYNTNAQVLESEVDYKFDQEVNKYLQSKSNPYGDKTYNTVDVSNIEQVIGSGENAINPLDGDIF